MPVVNCTNFHILPMRPCSCRHTPDSPVAGVMTRCRRENSHDRNPPVAPEQHLGAETGCMAAVIQGALSPAQPHPDTPIVIDMIRSMAKYFDVRFRHLCFQRLDLKRVKDRVAGPVRAAAQVRYTLTGGGPSASISGQALSAQLSRPQTDAGVRSLTASVRCRKAHRGAQARYTA